jgi:hypothetical protein
VRAFFCEFWLQAQAQGKKGAKKAAVEVKKARLQEEKAKQVAVWRQVWWRGVVLKPLMHSQPIPVMYSQPIPVMYSQTIPVMHY